MKPEILFLQQEDTIKAGLLDMHVIMQQVEKAYQMLGSDQVVYMPKVQLCIPQEENWDSFFMSMPAFLAGDVNIAGFKWAAESKFNPMEDLGLPYGIDVVMLSDPHTVLPKAIMDGTIITAMRTSAVAGMAAKYLASPKSKVACLVGAGVIGRTMIMAVTEAVPGLCEIRLVDLDIAKAEALRDEFAGKYNIVPMTSIEEGAKDADLVVTETTARKPIVKKSWLKKNATVIQMSGFELEMDIPLAADKLYVDSWPQLSHRPSSIIYHMCKDHGLTREGVIELQEMIVGEKTGRDNDDQFVVCCSMGLGPVDIMVAHYLYQNALKLGVGKKLALWDSPLWV